MARETTIRWGYINKFGNVPDVYDLRQQAEAAAVDELAFVGDTIDIIQIVTVGRVKLEAEQTAEPVPAPDTIEVVTVSEDQE